jgi:putative membrane protein
MTVRFLSALLFLPALAACDSSPDQWIKFGSIVGAPETDSADIVAVQQFADRVAASNLFEAEAGRLARDRGESRVVKEFGAMTAQQHADSMSRLKAALAASQPDVMLAPALTLEQRARLDRLSAAGGYFDDLFALQQVAAQKDRLALLRTYAASGANPAMRVYAADAAEMAQRNLAEARKLL